MKILILSLAFLALGESFTPPRAVKSSYTFHAHFMTGNEFQNTDSASTKNGAYQEVIDEEWESWKLEHNKVYKNEHEEKFRLKIFMENKHQIAQHNILYHQQKRNYSLTMNQFGDLLQHEFSGLMNGYRQDLKQQYGFTGAKHIPAANVQLPASIDWRKKGAVTPVKNQGHCGSCWAFSATGALEGQHFRQTGKLVALSEQNLVDCSYVPESEIGNHGCEGGIMDIAFDFINTPEHGIDTEKSYPYIGRDPVDKSRPTICHFKKTDIGATDTGHVDIESENENALKNALATIGPISVAIDASNLQFYDCSKNEGVFDGHCSSNQLNHGVLAVGYGTTKGGKDYWLIKNSWSEKWGCDGYFKLARNKNNKCGVATMASYPQV